MQERWVQNTKNESGNLFALGISFGDSRQIDSPVKDCIDGIPKNSSSRCLISTSTRRNFSVRGMTLYGAPQERCQNYIFWVLKNLDKMVTERGFISFMVLRVI